MITEYECWADLPAPGRMVREIADTLTRGETVWLSGAPSWPEEFRNTVQERLTVLDSGLNLEFVDARTLSPEMTAAKLVFSFDRTAKQEYLPAMNLAEFLKQRRILSTTILWLYHVDDAAEQKWLDFSRNLAQKAVPLRVVCEGELVKSPVKRVRVLSEQDLLTEFDYLLYAMMMVQNLSWNSDLKLYASRLAVSMSGFHAEAISELLSHSRELIDNPITWGRQVLPQCTEQELIQKLQTVQMISVMPKIELIHTGLIERIKPRINLSYPFLDDFENRIEAAEDLELRHVVYYAKHGKIDLTQDEYQLVNRLHIDRNKISHRKYISGEEVSFILSVP